MTEESYRETEYGVTEYGVTEKQKGGKSRN